MPSVNLDSLLVWGYFAAVQNDKPVRSFLAEKLQSKKS